MWAVKNYWFGTQITLLWCSSTSWTSCKRDQLSQAIKSCHDADKMWYEFVSHLAAPTWHILRTPLRGWPSRWQCCWCGCNRLPLPPVRLSPGQQPQTDRQKDFFGQPSLKMKLMNLVNVMAFITIFPMTHSDLHSKLYFEVNVLQLHKTELLFASFVAQETF